MEKIDIQQMKDVVVDGVEQSITEHLASINETVAELEDLPESISSLEDELSTVSSDLTTLREDFDSEVEGTASEFESIVSRLDEFTPDESGVEGTLEKWAGDIDSQIYSLNEMANQATIDISGLGDRVDALEEVLPDGEEDHDILVWDSTNEEWVISSEFVSAQDNISTLSTDVGNLENGKIDTPQSANTGDVLTYDGTDWVAQAPAGGLPSVTSEDAGDYFKVDENGNIIKYEPSTSIGDGEFSDGHWDSFVTGSAIEELVQQYYDFITGGSEVTEGCLGVKVQEIKERLEDFMDYEIIMGDPIHFTSDPDNHNLIYGTYTITGVDRVDVIRLKENYTGAFNDLIGITFLNLDTYSSWRPEGQDLYMRILNAERTQWEVEYGDTYGGDPVAWDIELIPYEVKKRLPNSNDKSYQILEELHREEW